MKISYAFGMASRDTFRVPPIRDFVERSLAALPEGAVIVDPFARNSHYGTVTNDLNPDTEAMYHVDAIDFLRSFRDGSADCVIYDPPYSPRQVAECYRGFGYEVTGETTRSSWKYRHMDEIARIVRPGGMVLSFGWNSNFVGKKRGFEKEEILPVSHGGGSAHDTVCVREIRVE